MGSRKKEQVNLSTRFLLPAKKGNIIGGIFSKPKAPKPPPLPPPVAIPEIAPETEDWAYQQARKKRGYTSTVITGALKPATSGKKTIFGE